MIPPKEADRGAFPIGALKLLPGCSIDDSSTDMAWIAAQDAPIITESAAVDRDGGTDEA